MKHFSCLSNHCYFQSGTEDECNCEHTSLRVENKEEMVVSGNSSISVRKILKVTSRYKQIFEYQEHNLLTYLKEIPYLHIVFSRSRS